MTRPNARKSKIAVFLSVVLVAAFVFSICINTQTLADSKEPHKYQIRVDLTENLVFIDQWNPNSKAYEPTEHIFLSSPGRSATPTLTGTFIAKPRAIDWEYDPNGTGEWVRFRSWASCYVNGVTTIKGAYYFHSVPSTKPDYSYVSQSDIDLLGQVGSHGCVRLWPRQAAWIRENCNGSTIKIYYGEGYDSNLWNLREALKKEAPDKKLWPNTVITENTKYIYTYFGDTYDSLAEMSGLTKEEIGKLNPGLNLKEKVPVGVALKIK